MTARVLLLIALVLWATCFVSSFALVWLAPSDSWWLVAALDKLFLFLLWQAIAAGMAFAVLAIGIWVEKDVVWRWTRWIPIAVLGLELLSLAVINLSVSNPPPDPIPSAVTQP